MPLGCRKGQLGLTEPRRRSSWTICRSQNQLVCEGDGVVTTPTTAPVAAPMAPPTSAPVVGWRETRLPTMAPLVPPIKAPLKARPPGLELHEAMPTATAMMSIRPENLLMVSILTLRYDEWPIH